MDKLTRAERRHQRAQRAEYAQIINDYQREKHLQAKREAAVQTADATLASAVLKGAA